LRSNYKMKRRIVHTLQKYLLNPPIKLVFAMGLALPGYALLETIPTDGRAGPPRGTQEHQRGESLIQ
jgi:hypothetical protein